jgi:photosystem I P700 chlorophyll a apoprotein A2
MVGAFAHGAIFVRDYDPEINEGNVLARMLDQNNYFSLKLVSLFLGFHTLGLYVHNDVVVAFFGQKNKF